MSIAQEFLSEREYTVDAKDGAEYLEILKDLLDDAPSLDQSGLSPASFGSGDVRHFFRGQTNGNYGINSSLYRVLKGSISASDKPRAIEEKMKAAEERVLLRARQQGIGRNLTSLELLTVLQHHLIPTRLIDVSASWKVALYFASEEKDSLDGRIFVIVTEPSLWEDFPRSKGQSPEWPHLEERRWQETTWPVLLPFTDPRMISQQGYFLVGGLATNGGGNHQYWKNKVRYSPSGENSRASLTQQELREVSTLMIKFPILPGGQAGPLAKLAKERKGRWTAVALSIPVPGAFKPQIREILKNKYDIDGDSIYPPIDLSSRLLKHTAETLN